MGDGVGANPSVVLPTGGTVDGSDGGVETRAGPDRDDGVVFVEVSDTGASGVWPSL